MMLFFPIFHHLKVHSPCAMKLQCYAHKYSLKSPTKRE
jgi:hypothetical protein